MEVRVDSRCTIRAELSLRLPSSWSSCFPFLFFFYFSSSSSFFLLLPSSSSSSFLVYVFFTYFSSSSSVTYPNNVALVAGEVITELH
jgi:hypothetical protein